MLNGLWLGHSRTFAELSWSHSFDFLACCWGCCPAEKWTVTPVWDQEHFGAGAHPGCLVSTMLHSSFPLSWLFSQFLLLKNIPTACCCHHHASLQGWYGLMIDLFSPNMKPGIHTEMFNLYPREVCSWWSGNQVSFGQIQMCFPVPLQR